MFSSYGFIKDLYY